MQNNKLKQIKFSNSKRHPSTKKIRKLLKIVSFDLKVSFHFTLKE